MSRSVKRIATRAASADRQAREAARTADSFENLQAKLGLGTDNISSGGSYGFNPITRLRTMLEWIHRGSWIGGLAIDIPADDMTRAGVELRGELDPQDIEAIEEDAVQLGIWEALNDSIKWSRLYGGCIGVYLIDGQKTETPLRIETVGKDQFRGILVLDRWMVEPSMQDLVTTLGPDLGKPKFYNVIADAPALPRMKIHHTRCFRMDGMRAPYWQRLTENLWGISEIERLYDRMVAFDSATTGAAQLVYKAYLRTMKIEGLREVAAEGGQLENQLMKYMNLVRRFQSIEGMTLIDAKDEFGEHGAAQSFSGLSDALQQFGQQIAGALQIPLVRLFGQSPGGLNSSGDSDLRTYYDGIKQRQERTLRVPVTTTYRMLAQSRGIELPEGFKIEFRNLWQLSDNEKAEIAGKVVDAVDKAKEGGLITQKVALKELRQSSHITGVFTNISDEEIDAAEDELLPGPVEQREQQQEMEQQQLEQAGSEPTGDAAVARGAARRVHGIEIVIENPKGSLRRGSAKDGSTWEAELQADYGYARAPLASIAGISGRTGADGEAVDAFVGSDDQAPAVWLIDQRDPDTQEFDEHKALVGFGSREDAMRAYTGSYSDGRALERVGSVSEYTPAQFKAWLRAGDLTRPASGWFNRPLRAVR